MCCVRKKCELQNESEEGVLEGGRDVPFRRERE